MRIPFNSKYWREIESGRYKVVTEHGESVEIAKWDCRGKYPILAVIDDGDTDDFAFFEADGTPSPSGEKLFIITDEPEMLTEFEKAVEDIYESCGVKELRLKDKAKELLAIARKELEKSHWIEMQEYWRSKGHLEGYAKGQEDAEERLREHTPIMYYYNPPCYGGNPCTNPNHDCFNCPRQGTSGISKTNTKVE